MNTTQKTKIMIVEDETIVALDIQNTLNCFGYDVVKIATNFDDSVAFIKEQTPDIILMDINLKESRDGIATATEIKKIKDIPIIYLTAFCDDDTINRAIETNPVGYLTKPFKANELKSTILLALFKSKQQNTNTTTNQNLQPIGDNYFYDTTTYELFYQDKNIKLSQKESQLLNILYQSKGQILSFETIEHTIWEDDIVSRGTLRTLIYRLRGKMEYKTIETVTSVGCRLL